jgi:hypothetical protein
MGQPRVRKKRDEQEEHAQRSRSRDHDSSHNAPVNQHARPTADDDSAGLKAMATAQAETRQELLLVF